jgi:hypothetical protein
MGASRIYRCLRSTWSDECVVASKTHDPSTATVVENPRCCALATLQRIQRCYDGSHCSLGAANMAIRDLTKSERQHAAIAEARKLADSGAYHDYTDIEYVLRFDQGLSDVSALLDSQPIHRDLNRRYADAREKQTLVAV